jgi:hypothetical protein
LRNAGFSLMHSSNGKSRIFRWESACGKVILHFETFSIVRFQRASNYAAVKRVSGLDNADWSIPIPRRRDSINSPESNFLIGLRSSKGLEPKPMEEHNCPKTIHFPLKMQKWCLVFRHIRCCAACHFLIKI